MRHTNALSQATNITAVNVAGGFYTLGTAPAATCTASDSFSGVASCTVTVTGAPNNSDVTIGGNGCVRNTIQNNVSLTGNGGPVSLQDTTITGNATVQNNGGVPVVATNRVSNILYCFGSTGAGNTAKTIYGTCTV